MYYRYGFNGKEKDDDIAGTTGAVYDYGFRVYDARIAKFLSVDPLTGKYPWYTPYQFAGNTPIEAIDLDGLEEFHTQDGDVTPYTSMKYEGDAVNKTTAFLYNSTVGALYNLSSLAINKTNQVLARPNETLNDVNTTVDNVGKNIKQSLTKPPSLSDVKEAFTDPKNYEAVPLALLGGLLKPKITIPSAVTVTEMVNSEMTTVGRWMSKTEYAAMKNGKPAAVGAGGKTSVTVGGPSVWPSATKGSVYAEFQVPTNSLVNGGGDGIFSIIGPNAGASQMRPLQKLGGQVSPEIQNLTPVLKVK